MKLSLKFSCCHIDIYVSNETRSLKHVYYLSSLGNIELFCNEKSKHWPIAPAAKLLDGMGWESHVQMGNISSWTIQGQYTNDRYNNGRYVPMVTA